MLTNKYNLPEMMVQAIKAGYYDAPSSDFTVTQLIGPPFQARLKVLHKDEIVEDASDQLWSLLGSAVHNIIEKAQVQGAIPELRLSCEIEGKAVSGKWDLYEVPTRTLRDFKVTSKFSVKYGKPKPEWVKQMNMLRYIAIKNGFQVDALWIHAILRDFLPTDGFKHDFPDKPFINIPIEIWDLDRTERFLKERVNLFKEYWDRSPMFLDVCSPDDRWNVTTYKVFKSPDATRAMNGGVVYTPEEAETISRNNPGSVIKITSVDKRCESYCSVKEFCKHITR